LLLRALLSTSALAILVHGGFLLFLQPDLSIGRGLPPLQFQQLFGHCPRVLRAAQMVRRNIVDLLQATN
jgi:hypothetical protein